MRQRSDPDQLVFVFDVTSDEMRRRSAIFHAIGDDWNPAEALAQEDRAYEMLYSGLDAEQRRIHDELVRAGVLPPRADR